VRVILFLAAIAVSTIANAQSGTGTNSAPGNQGSPTQAQVVALTQADISRILDSANQALSVTEKTANQTLAAAQTAIKTAETTVSEVRNGYQNLLTIFVTILTVVTGALGFVGFKTIPDKIKEAAHKHAEEILKPKLEVLDSTNLKQDQMISELTATNNGLKAELIGLRDDLVGIKTKSQEELQRISEHFDSVKLEHDNLTTSSRRSILALTQVSYGVILGIRAEAAATNEEEAESIWRESTEWLSRGSENSDGLEPSMQRWILLNLAFSQKRCGQPKLALISTEKALLLMKPEALVLYNAACYAALSQEHQKLINYLEAALSIDKSLAVGLIGDEENNIAGEPDMKAYWKDDDLNKLVARFKPQAE
jgi:predicted transcriptional regulator